MKTSPAFQFYWSDFINGTNHMTPEEVGGYIRLLCYQWDHGSVPDDDKRIAAITRCDEIAIATIRLKFGYCDDGCLRNERLEVVREAQRDFREKQSQNGKNRWKNSQKIATANAMAMPAHMPKGSQTDALCTLSSSKEEEERVSDAMSIYQKYPRKIGKDKAIKALQRALRTVPAAKIHAALDVWIQRWQAREVELQFIPYPATWVNSRYWEDETTMQELRDTPPPAEDPSEYEDSPKPCVGGGFEKLAAMAEPGYWEGLSQ